MRKKNTYQFTLILSGVNEETPELEDKIFEAGCDDALINFRNGAVFLDFDRKSFSFEEAVLSAIKEVESVLPYSKVIQVGPENLVTEAEIGKRVNASRQLVSQWVQGKKRNRIPFPAPIMKLSEKSPMWKWSSVCEWLYSNKIIKDHSVIEQSVLIENLNAALEERDVDVRQSRCDLLGRLSFSQQAFR